MILLFRYICAIIKHKNLRKLDGGEERKPFFFLLFHHLLNQKANHTSSMQIQIMM